MSAKKVPHKFYVSMEPAGTSDYVTLFNSFGWENVSRPDDADTIVFTGGADVTPTLYQEKHSEETGNTILRDLVEIGLFNFARANKIPMVGICRGGQFLNVMNGGAMVQDSTGHTLRHNASVFSGVVPDFKWNDKFEVTSTHHQIMLPHLSGKVLLVGSNPELTQQFFRPTKLHRYADVGNRYDVEAVLYPESRCLCYQPHPEMYGASEGCRKFFKNSINVLLSGHKEV